MNSRFTIQDLETRLRARRHKLTSQRRVVLEIFLENQGEHLSAEDVYDLLRDKGMDVGLATVYRSLELLAELGILQRMEFGDGCSRYELGDNDPLAHQHHHLICLRCGKVREFPDDMLDDLEREISEKSGFKIDDHKVMFFGYCKECQ